MKHKERAHLKEDPFVNFIEKILKLFQKKKRQILFGAASLAVLAVIIAGFFLIRSGLYARDNRVWEQALKIKNDTVLTTGEKVERLKKMGTGKGLAAVTTIYIAQVYYENREWQKAYDELKGYKTSRFGFINDNKRLLEAEILHQLGRKQEAEAIVTQMLTDAQIQIGKDFLLLKLAKIKLSNGETEAAKTTLQQLISDFPESSMSSEAQNLLSTLEEN